jgi:hypothetical protein
LYLPAKVVKRLNRERASDAKLRYYKLTTLAEQMLDEVAPHLPRACRVYVLFDAWYDSQHLLNFIRAHGWHFICATRSNRNLSGRPLCHWWPHLGYQRTACGPLAGSRMSWCGQPSAVIPIAPDSSSGDCAATPSRW